MKHEYKHFLVPSSISWQLRPAPSSHSFCKFEHLCSKVFLFSKLKLFMIYLAWIYLEYFWLRIFFTAFRLWVEYVIKFGWIAPAYFRPVFSLTTQARKKIAFPFHAWTRRLKRLSILLILIEKINLYFKEKWCFFLLYCIGVWSQDYQKIE